MRAINLSPGRLVAGFSVLAGILDFARRAAPHRWKRSFARELGLEPGMRWDVAMLQHCGYWSHFDYGAERSHWPIQAATTPDDVAAFGVAHALLRDAPLVGDIWLQYNPVRKGFVRAGVVARVSHSGSLSAGHRYFDILSLEADTGNQGELGGNQVLAVVRRADSANGDVFVRWSEAAPSQGVVSLRRAA